MMNDSKIFNPYEIFDHSKMVFSKIEHDRKWPSPCDKKPSTAHSGCQRQKYDGDV